MEIDAFRHAINIGLGRVILHLRNHAWKPYAQLIEHVCLHNTAYDAQCEGSRAQYVHEIVELTDDSRHFAGIVSGGLLESCDFWDTFHLFELAALFAKAGDNRARNAMYDKYRRQEACHGALLGGSQIVSVDGMAGLLFAAEQIGEYLATHPDAWADDDLLVESKVLLGADPEPDVRRAAESNASIRRYLEALDEMRKPHAPSGPDYHHLSYEELKEMIVARSGDVPRGWLFGWGRRASEDSLRSAAADLLTERDEKRLLAYLRIFNLRAFPLNPERMVEIARAASEETLFASIRALRHCQCEAVRLLALELLERKRVEGEAIWLLSENYFPGDEDRIESLLRQSTNDDEFHTMSRAALDVFESNLQADAPPSMLAIYERCQCSLCRHFAAKLLMDHHDIPEWMLQECRHDSYDGTREAAGKFVRQQRETQ